MPESTGPRGGARGRTQCAKHGAAKDRAVGDCASGGAERPEVQTERARHRLVGQLTGVNIEASA